jgi:predicted RNase H-like nuclease
MFMAGVDGCRAGWVCFKVEVASLATSVAVVALPNLLKNRPSDLAFLGIDSPWRSWSLMCRGGPTTSGNNDI